MRWTLPLLTLLWAAPAVAQVSPDETDPVKIMKAVEARASGDKVVGRLAMTVKDKQGRERNLAALAPGQRGSWTSSTSVPAIRGRVGATPPTATMLLLIAACLV